MTKNGGKKKGREKGQALLELAVNCKFITAEQEKEVLPKLLEFTKAHPKKSIANFLVEEKVLSKEKTRLLFSIHKHINLLMADKKFGKLGVANRFVEPDKVEKALALQIEIFRKRNKSVKIGDILVQNEDMTLADKTAVLLTQDRIKDELLPEALNTIAKSEIERLAINKRFGAIAVKKELVDTDQLNQALKLQKKELKESKEKRDLGDIFKELFSLSDEDILSVFKVQKKLETKRLNLEKHLYEYNSLKNSNATLDNYYEYYVAQDKLSAFVRQIKEREQVTALADFLNWFSLSGIKSGLCSSAKMKAFLKENKIDARLEIARGKAPEPFVKEVVEYHFDTRFQDNDTREIEGGEPLVKKDDVLAVITPHKEARAGKDVFGRPVYLPEEPVAFLGAGQGVVKKGNEFIALVPGHPKLFKDRTLFITMNQDDLPVLEIDGDIKDDTDETYLYNNLKVKGNIAKGVYVACHDLVIEGDIHGHVTATGNIEINGGIGEDQDDTSDNESPCQVEAKGSVRVKQKIINARIVAKQGFNAPKSDLVSSHILSCRDIIVNNVFSSHMAPSVLKVSRENVVEIQNIDKELAQLNDTLDKLLHKRELEQLSEELIKQIQIQNGYLEKQNVMLYLKRVINTPDDTGSETIDQKIRAYEQNSRESEEHPVTIAEHTKAHRFMTMILEKVHSLEFSDQVRYIHELSENISGMYKAAVKATDRINKKYDARSQTVETEIKKSAGKIAELKEKIEEVKSRRDQLLHEKNNAADPAVPVIRVKNQVEKQTIILGEQSKMVVDKSIYQVCLKEDRAEPGKEAKITVEGYY
jgi:hypothetical protein